ncbi:hypothetical protein ANANG_G00007150 [Anguilla anguilla]|uniref:Protein kinase domain-containing protein n=1 Tax=Anguilla anguilla TaxID=7936 RepID=A0A9D3N056_ANGAN|nr:hypothetical protein ANANG_G00007150 [Anguilla anguilla]
MVMVCVASLSIFSFFFFSSRSLQHPNVLQCLGQCSENIPFLLVMEFCQLGDLKRYLRAQRKSDGMTPDLLTRDLLTLQRMAYEITSGLLHLHENNYIHSDLALRNCLLTSDLTVRIGDYGLSHNHYKEDYYLTPDKLWIPLRWIAPELLEEFRGSLIVTDQTKTSNVWSLGVVIWELFEFGSQPHRHLSDEEVLTFVIRERQITLAQPRLKLSHADYWYEVMQSCWLPSSQRPSVAEIFLLMSSLLAAERRMGRRSVGEEDEDDEVEDEEDGGRGRRGESEESFERRWDSLRPPAFQVAASERQRERERERGEGGCRGANGNSFPLLDPVGNTITPSSSELDDILTVTETSKGLNFEYFWEKAHGRRGYKPLPPPQPIPTANSTHRHSLDTPTVVPVISARSPSLASEYYIRLEEHTPQDKSPTLKGKAHSLPGAKGHHALRSDSMCTGDLELVEIRSNTVGKDRAVFSPQDEYEKGGKFLQTVKSCEVQVLVPNTGLVEFSKEGCNRVTDFAVVDIGDKEEGVEGEVRQKFLGSSQGPTAPALPPKPCSSTNYLHSRPLPAPPLGYHRAHGLAYYSSSSFPVGKVESSDPRLMSNCTTSKANFDHLGIHRHRQTLPPSPSLSPSLPQASVTHPLFPPPHSPPPPLPPHYKFQKGSYSNFTGDGYSTQANKHTVYSQRDPLPCDYSLSRGMRRSQSLLNSNNANDFHSESKDTESPTHQDISYPKMTRSQSTIPKIEREWSSSPTYSEEDDSPFSSPVKPYSGTAVKHIHLSDDLDPATSELFSRGMKRTQSRLATILPAIWKEDAEMQKESASASKKSPMHLFLTEISNVSESMDTKSEEGSWDLENDLKSEGQAESERTETFLCPPQGHGMRRSQSLVTELGSAGQAWGSGEKNMGPSDVVRKGSFQTELFLTEIDTGKMVTEASGEVGGDSEQNFLPHWNSKSCPFPRPPVLPSYAEAEEAFSRGMRRSRSLLSEMTPGRLDIEAQKNELSREDFLKEIRSAETFLTEIMTRKQESINSEKEISQMNTPESPEYESVFISPDSSQPVISQTEKSVGGTDVRTDNTTEAIYAQVTKRPKRTEIKVTMRPEIPVLQIGSSVTPDVPKMEQGSLAGSLPGEFEVTDTFNSQSISESLSQSNSLSQPDGFVFSEIMPKNGLLLDQTSSDMNEDSMISKNSPKERGAEARFKSESTELEEGVSMYSSNMPAFSGEEVKSRQRVDLARQLRVQSVPCQGSVTEGTTDLEAETNNRHSHISTSTTGSNDQLIVGEGNCQITDIHPDQTRPDSQIQKLGDGILHGLKTKKSQQDQAKITVNFAEQCENIDVSGSSPAPDSLNEKVILNISQSSSVSDGDKSFSDNILKKVTCPETDQNKDNLDIIASSQKQNIEEVSKISSGLQIDCEMPVNKVGPDPHFQTESGIIKVDADSKGFLSFLGERGTDMTPLPLVSDSVSDLSLSANTPTDSAISPLTSSSLDCLTPGDPWGGGGSGWRALATDTPHRDSAYFSDSDWEGEGVARRGGEGVNQSRPSSSRSGERGILMGIEEKAETEEEGEMEAKTLRKESKTKNQMEETWITNDQIASGTEKENVRATLGHCTENKEISVVTMGTGSEIEFPLAGGSHSVLKEVSSLVGGNNSLRELDQVAEKEMEKKEFTEILSNQWTKCADSNLNVSERQAPLSEDVPKEGNAEFIAKLFSTLDCEPLKGFPCKDGNTLNYSAFSETGSCNDTDGIGKDIFPISHGQSKEITYQDPVDIDKDFNSLSNSSTERVGFKEIPVNEKQPVTKEYELGSEKELIDPESCLKFTDQQDKDLTSQEYHTVHDNREKVVELFCNPDNRESRLCRFYNVTTSDTSSKDEFDSVLEANHEGSTETINLSHSFWGERNTETPARKECHDLEPKNQDANELGLRNLCYSEETDDERAKAKSETEKQLAAGELCYKIEENLENEKQAEERVGETTNEFSARAGFMDNVDMESKGLELKAKELWNAMEEDEEERAGAVSGELDCYRFQKGDLHLWPAENDQWASAETRNQEVELGAELFSGFSRESWANKEEAVFGHRFWGAEENDELAGSEPHPSVQESGKDRANDESQGQEGILGVDESILQLQSMPTQASSVVKNQISHGVKIQQEENLEIPDLETEEQEVKEESQFVEVENLENPVQQTLMCRRSEDGPLCDIGTDSEEQSGDDKSHNVVSLHRGDFAEENQNFNQYAFSAVINKESDIIGEDACVSCPHSCHHSENHDISQITLSDLKRNHAIDCMDNCQILSARDAATEERTKDNFFNLEDQSVETENANSNIDCADMENQVLDAHEHELSGETLRPVNIESKQPIENLGEHVKSNFPGIGSLNSICFSDSYSVQGVVSDRESVKEVISSGHPHHEPSITESQTQLQENKSKSQNRFPSECHDTEIKDISYIGLDSSHTTPQPSSVPETQVNIFFENKQINSASSDSTSQIGNDLRMCSSVVSSNGKGKQQSTILEGIAVFDSDKPCSERAHDHKSHEDSGQRVVPQSLDSLPEPETLLMDIVLTSEHNLDEGLNCTISVSLEDSGAPPESCQDVTQNKGTSVNLEHSPVQTAQLSHPTDQQNLHQNFSVSKNEENTLSQKISLAQCSLTSIPELLISEWKDLDEEPLEDFEKLEQLCCISGDEDTLGDLFLDNLELLESLKKTPEQKSRGLGETGAGKDKSSTRDGERRMDVEGDSKSYLPQSDSTDQLLRASLYQQPQSNQEIVPGPSSVVQSSLGEDKHGLEDPSLTSPCHMSEKNKGQRSLSSKMPTKNGLMMQVCEERLQYSLSENVKKNVLWGATVSEAVVLHPWSGLVTEEGERQREKDGQGSDHKEEPQQAAQPEIQDEPFVDMSDPFTLARPEAEITPPLVVANQAMKAKLARLSLSLPPLALSLPLSPSPRVGFWEVGENRERGGRRRGASTGSDPDEEEDEEQEEDEAAGRVIVVTETDVDRRVGLRSLLKSPREPMEREKERGRNVSFFDDVTVYLFDQETPTNELSSGSAPSSPSPVQDETKTASSIEALGETGTVESKESEDLSINPKLSGTNPVTSSRFTVSPAHDPHLV